MIDRGSLKFLRDLICIFQISAIPALRHWYVTVLVAVLIPVPWFYVTRAIAVEDAQVLCRLMAGTLIFGVTFSIGMFVGQNWVGQRFSGSLKLLITMPVSKASYIAGSLLYSTTSSAIVIPFCLASVSSPACRSVRPGRCCRSSDCPC